MLRGVHQNKKTLLEEGEKERRKKKYWGVELVGGSRWEGEK